MEKADKNIMKILLDIMAKTSKQLKTLRLSLVLIASRSLSQIRKFNKYFSNRV